jgi:hypothetical protein
LHRYGQLRVATDQIARKASPSLKRAMLCERPLSRRDSDQISLATRRWVRHHLRIRGNGEHDGPAKEFAGLGDRVDERLGIPVRGYWE